jgi:hypothetical protein
MSGPIKTKSLLTRNSSRKSMKSTAGPKDKLHLKKNLKNLNKTENMITRTDKTETKEEATISNNKDSALEASSTNNPKPYPNS